MCWISLIPPRPTCSTIVAVQLNIQRSWASTDSGILAVRTRSTGATPASLLRIGPSLRPPRLRNRQYLLVRDTGSVSRWSLRERERRIATRLHVTCVGRRRPGIGILLIPALHGQSLHSRIKFKLAQVRQASTPSSTLGRTRSRPNSPRRL
ncbi:hypothetical protein C8Q80DRAFT_913087 [Daedaleopsis nitida]|nr:hypothetical protein C8Q80DRAFT_913087 [Daedaleopsis nitida]